MEVLGIDIGGSGIKGAPVDTNKGTLIAERHRIPTPQPSTPENVIEVVGQIATHFDWNGPIGCTFPAVVKRGVVYSAANVEDEWIGTPGQQMIQERTGCPTFLLNDADAAGYAEVQFGAGKDRDGVIMILTLGTGIGSALFVDGILVPNTELGHVYLHDVDAEERASNRAREAEDLSWKKWAKRLDEYLLHIESLFSPDLFIIGGGVSKKHEKFLPRLTVKTEVVPAKLRNEAGIIGAALAAQSLV
ncbi:MAG: ROK family protein [Chloroflexi bacterium]|nr:MAG: polyphosphate glucokinase [Phototrophicales bacterium]RMF79660.1 MAG: ROK family protein [Chloroflexota bacterium]